MVVGGKMVGGEVRDGGGGGRFSSHVCHLGRDLPSTFTS